MNQLNYPTSRGGLPILNHMGRAPGEAEPFLQSTLDALGLQLCVLDDQGSILTVNAAWRTVGEANGLPDDVDPIGSNYLTVCEAGGSDEGHAAAAGIRSVLSGEQTHFCTEYTCDSPERRSWFEMRVTPLHDSNPRCVVISHEDITARHAREEEIKRLNRLYASLSLMRQAIVRMPARDELFRQICQILGEYGGFSMVWIGWYDSETDRLIPVAEWGDETGYLKGVEVHTHEGSGGYGPSARAFRENRPYICNDFFLDPCTLPWRSDAEEQGTRACASFPIRRHDRPCGTLAVYAREFGFLQEIEVALLTEAAADISFALDNLDREDERRRAESQRDRFFTLSPDMLCIADLNGYFKRLSPAFSEALGFSQDELMAIPYFDFLHPDDRAATVAATETLSRGGSVLEFENRYRTRDGAWRWLEWKATSVLDEGVIYAAARDITEHKLSEAKLRWMSDELEARVKERTAELAKSNARLHVQVYEREAAEHESWTRALQQEAVADLGRRALSDMDLDSLLSAATTLVATVLNLEFSTLLELIPDEGCFQVRAATGWKPGGSQEEVYRVPGGSSSQAGYVLQTDVPVIVTDLQTETRFEPSAMLLSQGVVSGVTVVVRGHPQPFGTLGAHTNRPRNFRQHDVHFLQAVSNVLAGAIEQRRIESTIRQLNQRLTETNEQLEKENMERQLAIGALREVTAGLQRAKEESEEARENAEIANRAKSEFLSRMSHELRTPLNAILGFGQLLSKQDFAPAQQERVQHILKAGRHLLDLINEVLDIARIEAGHIELSMEPVQVRDTVQEVFSLLRPLASEGRIQLLTDEASMQDCYVMADRQRLKQVLLNLCSNAIKYNRSPGTVIVACQPVPCRMNRDHPTLSGATEDASLPGGLTDKASTSGEQVQINVTDTGAGIAPAAQAQLFVPFLRLDAGQSAIEGTGLGLAVSRSLTHAMGGSIGVDSTAGEGSTFWLKFALAQPPMRKMRSALTPTTEPAVLDARRFTLLYIEDNLSNLRLIEDILSDEPGYRLIAAMQGRIGLDLAMKHEPDLILLDIHLPDMPGAEVLSRLKSEAGTADIPVVVLSAVAMERQIEQFLGAGASAYLTKPLNVQKFLDTLASLLRTSEGSMSK